MPQFTEFPLLPKGEFKGAVDALIGVCRRLPPAGESLKEFRARLKAAGMFSRERAPALHRFLRMPQTDPIVPSPLVRAVAEATGDEAARKVLADRLWEVNPVLFKTAVERIKERVHSPNEFLKYVDSFAYPGARLTGPQITNWIQFAQGLEVFRPVGIRLGLDKLGEKFVAQAEALDLDEFFEEDRDEPEPVPAPAPMGQSSPDDGEREGETTQPGEPAVATLDAPAVEPPTRGPAPASVNRVAVAAPAPRRTSSLPSPLGRQRPTPVARFSTADLFPDAILTETVGRVAIWADGLDLPVDAPAASAFGLDPEAWNEDAERSLFRLAVAATLLTRLPPGTGQATFAELEPTGVLDALYDGSTPEGPAAQVDNQALLWVSVLSRRFSELPELAASLERAETADAVFRTLDEGLGRGLLGLELLWMIRELEATGLLKRPGLSAYTATPDRGVRDTLFRLGFLTSPYAPDGQTLAEASAAVRRAAGEGRDAEARLRGFAEAAGCAYDCPNRRRCEFACRERAGG